MLDRLGVKHRTIPHFVRLLIRKHTRSVVSANLNIARTEWGRTILIAVYDGVNRTNTLFEVWSYGRCKDAKARFARWSYGQTRSCTEQYGADIERCLRLVGW